MDLRIYQLSFVAVRLRCWYKGGTTKEQTMSDRDYQRQRVYNWEAEWIRPRIDDTIPFETAVHVGMHIWNELGLDFPPLFKPLAKQTRNWGGKANRTGVWLPDVTSTKTVIHEIAHSLSSDVEGFSHQHGPDWVGMYIKLLDRFTSLSLPELLYTLREAKVDFNLGASPVFLK